MARDDSPMIRPQAARRLQQDGGQCAVKGDRNLKTKLAIMRQSISVTDRQTDGLASWHKREMYILHLPLKIRKIVTLWLVLLIYSFPFRSAFLHVAECGFSIPV